MISELNLPMAQELSAFTLSGRDKVKDKVIRWINDTLLPEILDHEPKIDLKKRTKYGYVVIAFPLGRDNNLEEEWKNIFEEIVVPLGYKPVYVNIPDFDCIGYEFKVGVEWVVPL